MANVWAFVCMYICVYECECVLCASVACTGWWGVIRASGQDRAAAESIQAEKARHGCCRVDRGRGRRRKKDGGSEGSLERKRRKGKRKRE